MTTAQCLTRAWNLSPFPASAAPWLPPTHPPGGSNWVGFLDAALATGQSRHTPWHLDHLPSPKRQQATQAAQLYKRGVSVRGATPQGRSGVCTYHTLASHRDLAATDTATTLWVIDAEVARQWPSLIPHHAPHLLLITAETLKELATVDLIVEQTRRLGARHLVAVGGGCCSDITGTAATLAGLSFEIVATTLLAAIDASIGGKVAVNRSPYGKNQVGAFAFPLCVWAPCDLLTTLPAAQWLSGLGEMMKHALLAGSRDTAHHVLAAMDRLVRGVPPELPPDTVLRSLELKVEIAHRDPQELGGERDKLNFGHTLGHALESWSQHHSPLPHGMAVGWGMVFAAELGRRLEITQPELVDWTHRRYLPRLRDATGPLRHSAPSAEALWPLILHDKKRLPDSDHVPWILLQDWGQPRPAAYPVSYELFCTTWASAATPWWTP